MSVIDRRIDWPSRRLWLDAAKPQASQIKPIDKNINRPDRIVVAQIVIWPLGKQCALTAVIANDKARHRILRPNRRRIISSTAFSHGLDPTDVGSVARCSGGIVTAQFLAKWTSPFHRRRPNWALAPEGLVH
jgi:hypothetical protein